MSIENVGAAGGAPASKRDRTARASERKITWESLLLGGMVVAFALLSATVMLEIANFGARFAAGAVATERVTVRPVRARPMNLARPAHDAPPSMA
jgi:hypothetical protein